MDSARPILCLGEAIVDLICGKPASPGLAPDRLTPHPGGALANVAVAAARAGAPAALAGGVGDDLWGAWIVRRLERDRVSTRWLARLGGVDTPLGIAFLDPDGEPDFQIYGEHIGATMAAAGERLEEAIPASGALVIGSNTMVGPVERGVTVRALELARERGIPVLLDPNLRPNRWRDHDLARRYCEELAARSTVVKLNRHEAAMLTGEDDPRGAARALLGGATELVVLTDGDGPVLVAGAAEGSHRPPPATVVSPLGAGDAFMGAFAAELHRAGWDLSAADRALEPAAAAAARICGFPGAQG